MNRRTFLTGAALLGLASPAPAGPGGPVRVSITPPSPQPGDVVLLQVSGASADTRVEWDGHAVALFPTAQGVAALVGVRVGAGSPPVPW